jgi:hypothetical protein
MVSLYRAGAGMAARIKTCQSDGESKDEEDGNTDHRIQRL